MRTAVRGVVVLEGKLVLMHRIKNGEEYWVLPGGGVEGDESYEETVIREMEEEVGIKVKPVKEIVRVKFGAPLETNDFSTINIPGWEAMDIFYLCEYVSGEIGSGMGVEFTERSTKDNIYSLEAVSAQEFKRINCKPSEVKEVILRVMEESE